MDSKTGAGIAGAMVIATPPIGDRIIVHRTITLADEHGAYRITLAPDTYDLEANLGSVSDDHDGVALAPGPATRDFVLDHDAVTSERRANPPDACPASPPGTVLPGHSASQEQIDELARAVLGRARNDPTAIPDADAATEVQGEILLPAGRRLTTSAVPPGFMLRSFAELQAEADRIGHDVRYLSFEQLDTDGSCALVEVGGCDIAPSHTRRWPYSCGCSARDLYEQHAGRWVFVRRVYQACE